MRYLGCAVVLLSFVGCSSDGRSTPDPLIGRGRIEQAIPADTRDVASFRKLAETELAHHPRGFRLFAIYLTPGGFTRRVDYEPWAKQHPDKLPFSGAVLYYSRAVPGGWETLEFDEFPNTGSMGVTASSRDARSAPEPNPAPTNMPDADGALLRLFRNFPPERLYHTNAGEQKIEMRLTQAGATRWGQEGKSPEVYELEFFTATSPRGRWLWWTIVKRPARWEFVYVDAVTGAATSRCAEPRGDPNVQLVAIRCQ